MGALGTHASPEPLSASLDLAWALLAASARQAGGGWDAACPSPCWAAWSSAACCSHPPPLPPPRALLRAERCPSGPPGYRRWVEEVGQARWLAAVGPESSQEQATVWAPGAGGQRCRAWWAGGRGALSRGCGQWVPGSPEACSVEGPPPDVAQCSGWAQPSLTYIEHWARGPTGPGPEARGWAGPGS